MVDLTHFSGPGFAIAGLKGQFQQADGIFTWAAGGVLTPQMGKGLAAGSTVLAQVIRFCFRYTAAPGAVTFTAEQLRTFKNALFPLLSGSTAAGSVVDAGVAQGAGDVDQRSRLGLRYSSQGTLDDCDGSFTLLAAGVMIVDVVIPHANAVTGLDFAPDSGLIENRTWNLTLGSAVATLGSQSLTITGGQILTGNIIIKGRPGARGHLSYKRVVQNEAVDTLEPATRLVHIVTGSTVPTYAGALAALENATTVNLTAAPFVPTFAGVNAFNDQGYCNNALVWQALFSRLNNGALPMPGPAGAAGVQSYAMCPLYVWDGAAAGNMQAGPVGVNNATNLAASNRQHDWIAVVSL